MVPGAEAWPDRYSLQAEIHTPASATLVAQSLRRKRLQLAIKRGIDVFVSAAALLLLAPLMLGIALVVRLTSPGPVLFRQQRVGRFQREFRMLKFRSMRVEQGQPWSALARNAANSGKLLKVVDDPRLTRAGRFLRRWSLDELPQLINVLRGDMSLVGPRPLLAFMLKPCPEFAEIRSLVRPGLTGLWQVSDREDNTSAAAMRPHDLRYVSEFTLALDLWILARTIPAVVSQEGAW